MSNLIGQVISTNISFEKGTTKNPVEFIDLNNNGIIGDVHAGNWHRQVSLLSIESIDKFNNMVNKVIKPGEFAENITLKGIDLTKVSLLDRFNIGDVVLEVTQIGKKCHGEGCAVYQQVGKCVMPKEGIFCRVLHGGKVKSGDAVDYFKRRLSVSVFTVSDRAFNGVYEDRSGPVAKELIRKFLINHHWNVSIDLKVIPDEKEVLTNKLNAAISNKIDLIFTLGGTGIGSRDITPEIVVSVCDKIIPGVMENIRIKYGNEIPSALLSRSVAGVADKTLIYALPGSVKAVQEYLSELFKSLEHAVFMMRGLGH